MRNNINDKSSLSGSSAQILDQDTSNFLDPSEGPEIRTQGQDPEKTVDNHVVSGSRIYAPEPMILSDQEMVEYSELVVGPVGKENTDDDGTSINADGESKTIKTSTSKEKTDTSTKSKEKSNTKVNKEK
jgi:hypothetical protein